jgi:hypothetical protein
VTLEPAPLSTPVYSTSLSGPVKNSQQTSSDLSLVLVSVIVKWVLCSFKKVSGLPHVPKHAPLPSATLDAPQSASKKETPCPPPELTTALSPSKTNNNNGDGGDDKPRERRQRRRVQGGGAYPEAMRLCLLAPVALLHKLERCAAGVQDLVAVHAEGRIEEGVVLQDCVQVWPQGLELVLLRLRDVCGGGGRSRIQERAREAVDNCPSLPC